MHGVHIGGQRAGAFLELVGGVDPKRVLLVGIDVAKATWFVVASNLLGEVVVDGVRLVADRAGLAELERMLGAASARVNAAMVVVGIEAAGHHHQTLTAHLLDRDELVVRVLNPAQVAAVRNQQGNRRRKTDWLDAAAVCELLARGEGALVHLDGSAASALRPLWSGRKDLVDTRSRLRQQAGALVDCLWPGCSAKDTAAGVTPVLCDLFATKAGRVLLELLAQGWTPARVAATSVAALRGLFAVRGCRLTRPLATRLIGRAQAALPAHPAATADQGGRPGRSAWHDRHPRPRDRLSGGGHGAPAGRHPGRQAHPAPRGGRGRRGRGCGLHRADRPVGGLVKGVAGGRPGPGP